MLMPMHVDSPGFRPAAPTEVPRPAPRSVYLEACASYAWIASQCEALGVPPPEVRQSVRTSSKCLCEEPTLYAVPPICPACGKRSSAHVAYTEAREAVMRNGIEHSPHRGQVIEVR